MARPLRIEYPGAVYHVTSRGNHRGGIFLNRSDRVAFLSLLAETVRRFHLSCYAYCLMGNHYHLLLETSEPNLARAMRHLNGVYTQRFNWEHSESGHLLQGRYAAILIDKSSHLLEVCRYIALNPVRAGLAPAPSDWEWSSYRATVGLEEVPGFMDASTVLAQFGHDAPSARRRYAEFVQEGDVPVPWSGLTGGLILGDENFAARCRLMARAVGDLAEIPKEQKHIGRPPLDELLRGPAPNGEKWRLAVDAYGYTQNEVAAGAGVHYSWVSRVLAGERSKVKT
ncbi:MAG: transposase [Elusimicrobiota bacterium]